MITTDTSTSRKTFALHRIASIVLEQVQKMQRQRPICDSIPGYKNLSRHLSRRRQPYNWDFLVLIRLSQQQYILILFQILDIYFLNSLKYYFKNGLNVRYLSSHYCNVNNADHNQPIIRLRQLQDIKNNRTLEVASGRMIRYFLLSIFVVNLGFGSTTMGDTHAAKRSTSKFILLNHAEEPLDLFWIQKDESTVKMTFHPLRNGTSATASFSCLLLTCTIFTMT